ncbi:hypothetical protein PBI_GAIA_130 [Mycobacterium phage Gaia]|uniref:Uncharacterized protein n=1 Tax=Mycobacterium phage Gaia TaxID=1486472 RepID=A0A068F2J8_9CAUD|nr:hypothetical protein VC46_gp103 [Mycobacterium phage Gaia]AID58949.1 hypothetical protein PBI_GAIA_130 [Mycobacterium phage Gaia]AYR00066.1 hypothetical protein PBI_NEBKISS_131 [Mycobacterium phage Nebkiss]
MNVFWAARWEAVYEDSDDLTWTEDIHDAVYCE